MTVARGPHAPLLDADRELAIRLAGRDDDAALARLAALDSQLPLDGDALVATVDGVMVAALSLSGGRLIADPFKPTAAVGELLRLRATSIAAPGRAAASLRRWRRLAPVA